jgi:hypothetical protein
MAEHTPGPYFGMREGNLISICAGDPTVRANRVINYLGFCYSDIESESEQIANAHLFMAAPDLLAACEAAQDELERLTGDAGFEPERFRERIAVFHALTAAIAKAKKEEA